MCNKRNTQITQREIDDMMNMLSQSSYILTPISELLKLVNIPDKLKSYSFSVGFKIQYNEDPNDNNYHCAGEDIFIRQNHDPNNELDNLMLLHEMGHKHYHSEWIYSQALMWSALYINNEERNELIWQVYTLINETLAWKFAIDIFLYNNKTHPYT